MIRIGTTCIKHEPNPKYLGVLLGKGFDPTAHISYAGSGALAKYNSIRPVAKVKWGIAYWSRRVLYKALFETVASY